MRLTRALISAGSSGAGLRPPGMPAIMMPLGPLRERLGLPPEPFVPAVATGFEMFTPGGRLVRAMLAPGTIVVGPPAMMTAGVPLGEAATLGASLPAILTTL